MSKYIKCISMLICLTFSANALSYNYNPYDQKIKREVKRQIEKEEAKRKMREQGVEPGPLWDINWGGTL